MKYSPLPTTSSQGKGKGFLRIYFGGPFGMVRMRHCLRGEGDISLKRKDKEKFTSKDK